METLHSGSKTLVAVVKVHVWRLVLVLCLVSIPLTLKAETLSEGDHGQTEATGENSDANNSGKSDKEDVQAAKAASGSSTQTAKGVSSENSARMQQAIQKVRSTLEGILNNKSSDERKAILEAIFPQPKSPADISKFANEKIKDVIDRLPSGVLRDEEKSQLQQTIKSELGFDSAAQNVRDAARPLAERVLGKGFDSPPQQANQVITRGPKPGEATPEDSQKKMNETLNKILAALKDKSEKKGENGEKKEKSDRPQEERGKQGKGGEGAGGEGGGEKGGRGGGERGLGLRGGGGEGGGRGGEGGGGRGERPPGRLGEGPGHGNGGGEGGQGGGEGGGFARIPKGGSEGNSAEDNSKKGSENKGESKKFSLEDLNKITGDSTDPNTDGSSSAGDSSKSADTSSPFDPSALAGMGGEGSRPNLESRQSNYGPPENSSVGSPISNPGGEGGAMMPMAEAGGGGGRREGAPPIRGGEGMRGGMPGAAGGEGAGESSFWNNINGQPGFAGGGRMMPFNFDRGDGGKGTPFSGGDGGDTSPLSEGDSSPGMFTNLGRKLANALSTIWWNKGAESDIQNRPMVLTQGHKLFQPLIVQRLRPGAVVTAGSKDLGT